MQNRKPHSSSSSSSSSVSSFSEPNTPKTQEFFDDDISFWRQQIPDKRPAPVPVAFNLDLTGRHHVAWNGVLYGKTLFLPFHEGGGNSMAASSKEGFVSLLEYAEGELACEHIVVSIPKRAKERASLVKTFMFMGFTVLPPNHELIADASNADSIYLDYEI